MPGVRWGADITDEAATRVREIDNLTSRIGAAGSPKSRSQLEAQLRGLKAETASIFGSERGARSLSKFATYDGDPALLPKSITNANPNMRARPKLSKSAHRIATRAGARQNREGFGQTPGSSSAYSVGRAGRASARNPIGREGGPQLAAARTQAAADIKTAKNKVSRAKRTAAKKAAAKKAAPAKKAAKPRAPRKPKAS